MKTDMNKFDNAEKFADELERHAETQVPGERVIPPMYGDHRSTDAPGWCRKIARKVRARVKKSRKNFESKQRERSKHESS